MEESDCVVACSALKRIYRDYIRKRITNVFFLHLDTPRVVIEERLASRQGHFAGSSLLDSQYQDLERLDMLEEPQSYTIENHVNLADFLTRMLQPERQSSEAQSKSITPDGGIVKIPIVEKKEAKSIQWSRGMNAKFYYKAFAYITPQGEEKQEHSEKCGSHCKHSEEEKQEILKKKADMLKMLLDGKPKKASQQEQSDPSKRPIRTLISNSRENDPEPFELRIGYSFSVSAMEIGIKTMKVGEKARFLCMPEYCEGFAQLESVMRQEKMNKERAAKGLPPLTVGGCCAHASPEILELSKGLEATIGAPIEFEFELVSVQQPNTFKKEVWEMEPIQKYQEIPIQKKEAGELYKNGDYQSALAKYEFCLQLLESLSNSGIVLDMRKEEMDKKRGVLSESILPTDNQIRLEVIEEQFKLCRLNYAACKLKLKDYPPVIQQCTEVLKSDPKCIKALFRRAQAYLESGIHLDLSERDIETLKETIDSHSPEMQELRRLSKQLDMKLKNHLKKEKQMYGGLFKS
jgi:tetratricopeptide (TPR) repeat protein